MTRTDRQILTKAKFVIEKLLVEDKKTTRKQSDEDIRREYEVHAKKYKSKQA